MRLHILSNVKDLAYGTHHACYLFDNGTVSCTGKSERNQLGVPSTDLSNGCGSGVTCSLVPLPIEGGFTNIIQIDAGNRHTAAVLDNGSLVVWGINSSGELGLGYTNNNVGTPTVSTTAPSGVLKVWAQGSKTCVATNKYKTLHCVGSTFVGNNSSTAQSSFVEVDFPSAFGSYHRILDVAMTSGGVCIYTEYLANAFNGSQYIMDDVFCTGSWENAIGAGSQAVPVRTPVQLGTPF
mgnify:CR=1 FL=1